MDAKSLQRARRLAATGPNLVSKGLSVGRARELAGAAFKGLKIPVTDAVQCAGCSCCMNTYCNCDEVPPEFHCWCAPCQVALHELGLESKGAYRLRTADDSMQYKVVRHVRTAAGEQRYGQPIGSVIVRDGTTPLRYLTVAKNDYPGWQKLKGSDTNHYYVGKEGDKWLATDSDDNILLRADNEDDVYQQLDDWVDKHGVTVTRMSRAQRAAERARLVVKKEPKKFAPKKNFKKVKSDYEGYTKFTGDDGHSYYLFHDEDTMEYVIYDEQDKEVGVYITESDAMADLVRIIDRRLVEQEIAKRRVTQPNFQLGVRQRALWEQMTEAQRIAANEDQTSKTATEAIARAMSRTDDAETMSSEEYKRKHGVTNSVGHNFNVGTRVVTEYGSGTVMNMDRSLVIELDSGDKINVTIGTPGFDRLRVEGQD